MFGIDQLCVHLAFWEGELFQPILWRCNVWYWKHAVSMLIAIYRMVSGHLVQPSGAEWVWQVPCQARHLLPRGVQWLPANGPPGLGGSWWRLPDTRRQRWEHQGSHENIEDIAYYVSNYQRCHRYYPKFPELYSRRINSLIITALKYLTEH